MELLGVIKTLTSTVDSSKVREFTLRLQSNLSKRSVYRLGQWFRWWVHRAHGRYLLAQRSCPIPRFTLQSDMQVRRRWLFFDAVPGLVTTRRLD